MHMEDAELQNLKSKPQTTQKPNLQNQGDLVV
jgi:hypothetical protein